MRVVRVAILLLPLLAVALWVDWNPVTRLVSMIVIALLCAYGVSAMSVRSAAYERSLLQTRAHVGDLVSQRIVLTNTSRLPKLWLEYRDHSQSESPGADRIVTLRGKQSIEWSFATVFRRRGRHFLGPASIRGVDPFGIFGSRAWLRGQLEIIIYPLVVRLPGFTLPSGMLTGGRIEHRRTHIVTPAVSTIRDYVPGDALSRVSWNATARHGKLMVKEFEPDPQNDVWIILDLPDRTWLAALSPGPGAAVLEYPESLLEVPVEYLVSATASLARATLDKKRAVGLVVHGTEQKQLPPEASERQYLKVLEALAVANEKESPATPGVMAVLPPIYRHNVVLLVTAEPTQQWIAAASELRHRGVQVCAVLLDVPSFGGIGKPDASPHLLAEVGIPYSLIRRGTPLAQSLQVFQGLHGAGQGLQREFRYTG